MELSVAIPQKPSIRLKLFLIIAFIWLLPSLALLHISSSYNQSLESVEELGLGLSNYVNLSIMKSH
ncbi:hypothetical protein [Vibrio gallaecicus]|uniref:hypothetical protein n=1 Tax=Vibrio gallaecicus TaxID=552386 RepID=UPI0025B598FF|nr:hypothetical protein [Vibrio gallaecicus]MDN3613400.1 hypothetical protein [Vibrio gallaecicus]